MKQTIPREATPLDPSAALEATENIAETRLLMARAADRAFDAGERLLANRDRQMFKHAGHSSFEAYLDAEGFKRSTAYNNMRLAETFDRQDLAFGVSKLRLLVQAKFAAPRTLLLEGVPLEGEAKRSVEAFTYRELAAWVKAQPDGAASHPSPVAAATLAAVAGLLCTSAAPEQAAA